MDDFGSMLARILVALALGGVIGLEREMRDRAAGFRTHILVSVGAAAFTLASLYGFDDVVADSGGAYSFDPSRVAAQIVSGIGFLGAGAIIRHGVTVRGLTTAAGLWTAAAVGMLSGLGMYFLAAGTAAVVVISLSLLRFVEGLVLPRSRGESHLFVRFGSREYGHLSQVVELLDEQRAAVLQMRTDPEEEEARIIHLRIVLPEGVTENAMVARIGAIDGVVEVKAE